MSAAGERGQAGTLTSQFAPRLDTTWAYARHELLYLFWVLMEVALIMPLALMIMPWTVYWPPSLLTIWFVLIILIPFNLSRLMSLSNVPINGQRRVMMLALFLTIIISMRNMLYDPASLFDFSWLGELFRHFTTGNSTLWTWDLVLFFLVIFAWWRGLALTRRRVDIQDVGLRLRAGGLIMAPIVVALSLAPQAASPVPYVLLYFLAGLMSTALTRAEAIALQQTGHTYPMRPGWTLNIFLTSLLIVLVAGALAVLLSGQGFPLLVAWLAPLWDAVKFLSMVVITTTTYLLLFILRPLQWFVALLYELLAGEGIEQVEPEELPQDFGGGEIGELIDLISGPDAQTMFWINRGLTVLVIVVVLLLLYIALNHYFRQRQMPDALGESPLAGGRSRDRRNGLGRRLLDRLGLFRQWRAAATVRRLYRQMCDLAAREGYQRLESQTPYEYLATLAELWPAGEAEAALITEAYVRVRYGELPETQEELDQLRSALERLAALDSEP
jgi:hypothetical protein